MRQIPSDLYSDKSRQQYLATVIIIFILTAMILILHARYYYPFISDDALISLRYADRLLDGYGLTWTDGQPVEGYSNLLWILLIAAVGSGGVDLIVTSRLLGLLFMFLAVCAIMYKRPRIRLASLIPTFVGLAIFISAAPTAVWTIGGLEQPLVAALLGWALVLFYKIFESEHVSNKYIIIATIPLALLVISRPDGCLFTVAVVVSYLIIFRFSRTAWPVILRIIALPLLFFIGQMIFRLYYYGEWLPNPALVKIGGTWQHLFYGLNYLKDGYNSLAPFSYISLLFVLFALIFRSQVSSVRRKRIILLFATALIWSAYIAYVGGDIFPAWRHFVPLILVIALIIVEAVDWVIQKAFGYKLKILLSATMSLSLGLFVHAQFSNPMNRLAVSERWEWDGQVIGQMLKEGFGEKQPLMAVTAAGCLPYWSELPSIDMLGLNDYYLPRHRPENFGSGWVGHELGDGRYVLDRKPDLVIFCGPAGSQTGCFRSGKEMKQEPEFGEFYSAMRFTGHTPHMFTSTIWIRRFSEKIGIQKTDSTMVIPAYLMNGLSSSSVHLNDSGKFVISVMTNRPAIIKEIVLPAGSWLLSLNTELPVQAVIRLAHNGSIIVEKPVPVLLNLADTTELSITLSVAEGLTVELQEAVLTLLKETKANSGQ